MYFKTLRTPDVQMSDKGRVNVQTCLTLSCTPPLIYLFFLAASLIKLGLGGASVYPSCIGARGEFRYTLRSNKKCIALLLLLLLTFSIQIIIEHRRQSLGYYVKVREKLQD